ncbi:MAG: triple tyrosine motif-containing protein [Sediminicola sp.]
MKKPMLPHFHDILSKAKKKVPLLIMLVLPAFIMAQVKSMGLPKVDNFKKSAYNGGTQNWGIDQDLNGNVYFANNNGLLQFDGTTWRTYRMTNSRSVRAVRVDSVSGRIYVGGYSEFGYFESTSKGALRYISLLPLLGKTDLRLLDFIWKIHIHNGEVIFQSFQRAYILRNGQLAVLEAPDQFQFSFLVEGRLYFQDNTEGVLEYKNGFLFPLKGTQELNTSEIWGLFAMPGERLLMATMERGLFVYENEELKPWDTEANEFLKHNSSLGGVVMDGELLALNSVLDGLIICDLDGKVIQHLNYERGLQNNTVLSSFVDSKNGLWLGLDNGISFMDVNAPFTYLGYNYNLSAVYASVIHKGSLYVATNQGVFYHSMNGSAVEDTFTLVEGTTAQSWNVEVIGDQLLCANNMGALVIEGGRVVKTLDRKGYYGFKVLPSRPNFVVGSSYGGFGLFKLGDNGLDYVGPIKGVDKSSNFFEVDNDFLWLRRDQYLYRLEFSPDLNEFINMETFSKLGPESNGIGSLQRINDKVYFQANNQFYTYSKTGGRFIKDDALSALFKDLPNISTMTEDSLGNLWYTFDESLGVFMKGDEGGYTNVVAPFSNLTNNLITNYLSINTVDEGNIFIGLTDGLAHYDPQFSGNFVTKPKVFIRSFSYPNDTIIYGNPQLRPGERLIPYKSNKVRFTFSSPTYENLENVEYRYRLEPYDAKWSGWTKVPMKEYTNLREGAYTMKVRARNSYGIPSNEASVSFGISPPWYRHYLAYTGYVILAVTIIYLIYLNVKIKIRKNRYYETVEQRKLYLEKQSRIMEQQRQLEKEIESLKSNHLKTKILTKDKELVNNSLRIVKKNRTLNSIVHKLKDINTEVLDDNTKNQVAKLKKSIVQEVNSDKSWKDLEKHIKNVHFDFLKRLKEKHPNISPRELDLSTYLLLNMSTKEIAEVMNISTGGVELARYRLRKKLGLGKKENLTGYFLHI